MRTFLRNKLICTLLLLVVGCFANAQELEARVEVVSQKVTGVDASVFNILKQNISELLNTTNWTNENFDKKAKIPCTFILTIENKTDKNTYEASLQVQAKRPVFKSSYATPLLNHKDKQVVFSFLPNEALQYSPSGRNHDLVAIIAYYAHLIIGLDADSFASYGGTEALKEAQNIVNQQNTGESKGGWATTPSDLNRYRIIEDLLTYKNLRQASYTYHREGLDRMVETPEKALDNLLKSLDDLEKVFRQSSNTSTTHLFFDAKAQEIVASCSVLPQTKRQKLHKLLTKIAPGHLGIFKALE